MTASTDTHVVRLVMRWVLAGPVAAVVAFAMLMGMPIYLPPGAGNIDNLVIPILLLPIVWAWLFFHAVLDRSLTRVAAIFALLLSANLALLAVRFWG